MPDMGLIRQARRVLASGCPRPFEDPHRAGVRLPVGRLQDLIDHPEMHAQGVGRALRLAGVGEAQPDPTRRNVVVAPSSAMASAIRTNWCRVVRAPPSGLCGGPRCPATEDAPAQG